MEKEQIYEQIRLAGYNYAKDVYVNWEERYMEELDAESWYKDSLDEHGHPKEEKFSEQVGEESYHNYCDGDNDDFFEFFEISGVSQEERKSVEDDELYEILDEGITKFINETYHKC